MRATRRMRFFFVEGRVSTNKLADALKQKFGSPKALAAALGLDEELLKSAAEKARAKLAQDSKETSMSKPTRLEYLLVTRTARALNPQLAFDAKVDYSPVFAGITTKNFAERKTKIVPALAWKSPTNTPDAPLSSVPLVSTDSVAVFTPEFLVPLRRFTPFFCHA